MHAYIKITIPGGPLTEHYWVCLANTITIFGLSPCWIKTSLPFAFDNQNL